MKMETPKNLSNCKCVLTNKDTNSFAKHALINILSGKQPIKKTPKWVLEGLEHAYLIYQVNGKWKAW